MGERIRNTDAAETALTVQQAPGSALPAIAATAQAGPALLAVGGTASIPALQVRGPGDLLSLRDSNGAEIYKIAQSGTVSVAGTALPVIRAVQSTQPSATGWNAGDIWIDTSTEL